MNGVQTLLLMMGALAITALMRRSVVPPALSILVASAAASFIPGIEPIELDPHVILGVVMPPIIFAATMNTSFFDFMRLRMPIMWLGVVLVVVTAFAVGWVTSLLFPAMGLVGAFALAAVISPADTVISLSHAKDLGFPRKVTAILMGESLVNDAAALAIFAAVMAWAGAGTAFIRNPLLSFLYGAVVGSMIGFFLGNVAVTIRARIHGATLKTSFGLVLPFAAYVAAEHVHASGVLAVVFAGFSMTVLSLFTGHPTRPHLEAEARLQDRAVWRSVDALLEAFVFVYMGLRFKFVLEATVGPIGPTLIKAVAILVLTLIVRVVVVKIGFFRGSRAETGLVSWLGMRGIVTLAAAGGIPYTLIDGTPFPERATIQFIAFVVTLGSLLIQGTTVPYVVKVLGIDVSAERESEMKDIEAAEQIAREAGADFAAQRVAISFALRTRKLDDAAATEVLLRIDRREVATSTGSSH